MSKKYTEEDILKSYEGRCFSDKQELGTAYCGSCSFEVHRDQLLNPNSWITDSTVKCWLEKAPCKHEKTFFGTLTEFMVDFEMCLDCGMSRSVDDCMGDGPWIANIEVGLAYIKQIRAEVTLAKEWLEAIKTELTRLPPRERECCMGCSLPKEKDDLEKEVAKLRSLGRSGEIVAYLESEAIKSG